MSMLLWLIVKGEVTSNSHLLRGASTHNSKIKKSSARTALAAGFGIMCMIRYEFAC